MAVLYSNNASTTLAASITAAATSFSVATGKGSLFPSLAGSDYFYVTLINTAGVMEIMKVTARGGDNFVVTRGQDGTSAVAWAAGDRVELRITKAMLDDLKGERLPLTGGTLTGALVSSSGNPLSFTALGNGTYNIGAFYVNSSLMSLEAPLASDSAGAAQIPLILTWRGGYGDKGGLKLLGGASAELGGNTVLHAGNYTNYNFDSRYPRVYRGTADVSSAAFTCAFTVTGSGLASAVRFTVQGTTGSVVVNVLADLTVNHYQDILIKTQSGFYTVLTIKVVSDDNDSFAVLLSTNSANVATLAIEVFPLNSETVTFTSTNPYAGSSLTHTCPYGVSQSGTGGNSGDLNVAGSIYQAGNQVLHAGNYSSYAAPASHTHSYLPLSGGTITGNIIAADNNVGGVFGNLEIGYGGRYNTLQTKTNADTLWLQYGHSGPVGIGYGGGATTVYGTLNSLGALTQGGNQVLHAGNYTSYSPSLSGNYKNISAGGLYSRYSYNEGTYISDATSAYTLSPDYGQTTVAMHTSHGMFGGWATTLTMSGYERYGAYQISGNYNASTPELAIRNYNQGISGWTSWVKLLSSANYTSYTDGRYVLKTGDTMTGTLQFSALSNSIIAQHDGTGYYWRGRIISRNSDINRAVFLGNYNGKAGLFAHTNAIDGWAPLYLNTLGSDGGYNVYLPHNATYTMDGGNNTYPILNSGNYTDYFRYNTWDDWLRDKNDDQQFKLYGNTRTVIFRTDGTTNDHGGGAYAYIWYYGSSSDSERRMILNTSGQLWLSNYGWLHDAFASTGHTHSWPSITSGYRENYDLGIRPADNSSSYAGFRFATPGNDANAGYLLIRGGADNDVYTQNGITLVADAGWLTLAQRYGTDKGVRLMTNGTTRLSVNYSGDIAFVNGNSINYNSGRMVYGDSYASDENYNTGSIGRSGVNIDDIFQRRSGFIDVWAVGGTQPFGGTSHVTGFQSMHYWNGSTGYGLQVVGNHENRSSLKFRLRSSNGINPWYDIIHSGNYTSYSDGRYVLKTGDSMTGRLTISPGWTTTGRNYSNEWIEFSNYTGLYSPNNGAHFYPNSASYGSWMIAGTRNGWAGIEFNDTATSLMMNSNESGHYRINYGWQFRWYDGTLRVGKNSYGGNEAIVLDSSNYTNYTLPIGGGWYGSGLPGSRWGGYSVNGGEISFGRDLPNNGQMGILVDGCYVAGENNGFWSLGSDNTWGSRRGMYWDGSYLRFDLGSPVVKAYAMTVGNWDFYENAGGWNANIIAAGIYHGRVRVKASSYNSSGDQETYMWVDNTVNPATGMYSTKSTFNFNGSISSVLVAGNAVLHAGNFTNYVPYGYPGWPGYPGTDANTFHSGNWLRSSFTYSNNAPYTGTIVHFPSSGYDLQLNGTYGGTSLAFRNRNGDNGTWNAWSTVLHSNNYTSYGDGRYLRGDGTTPVTANNLNFGIGRYFGYTYIQTFSGENLHLNPSTSNGGDVYIRGNLALHAGNISSYVTSAPTAFNVVGSIAYLYRTNGGNNSALAAGVSVSGSTLFYCSTARTDSGYTGFVSNVGYNGSGIGRTTAFTASNGAGTFSPIGGTWRSLSYVSPAVYDSYGGTTYAGGLYVRVA